MILYNDAKIFGGLYYEYLFYIIDLYTYDVYFFENQIHFRWFNLWFSTPFQFFLSTIGTL